MAQRKQKQVDVREQTKYFFQWVLFISFIFTLLAAIITGSFRISFGAFVMGVFVGYLIYMGKLV